MPSIEAHRPETKWHRVLLKQLLARNPVFSQKEVTSSQIHLLQAHLRYTNSFILLIIIIM